MEADPEGPRPSKVAGMRMQTRIAAKASLVSGDKQAGPVPQPAPLLGMHIAEALNVPLLVLRQNFRICITNQAFLSTYGLKRTEVEQKPVHRLPGYRWNARPFLSALKRVADGQLDAEQVEFEQSSPRGEQRSVSVRIQAVETGEERNLLVTVEDVLKPTAAASASELRRAEKSLEAEALGRTEAETALHDTKAALLLSREQLRALAASLFDAQEAERRHVSRELHDDLSQKVAKLQFDLETLAQQLPSAQDGFKGPILAIRDEVAALADDLRRLAHRLHPSTLEHLGLPVALRSYVRDFSERERVRVELTTRKVPRRIATEVATSIYRVVQEALRNVVKHAGNADTAITLNGSSTQLCLTVRDRGPGFDLNSVQERGGLGLISMQERVRLVRGDFSLKTRPGQGVAITVRVPLV